MRGYADVRIENCLVDIEDYWNGGCSGCEA